MLRFLARKKAFLALAGVFLAPFLASAELICEITDGRLEWGALHSVTWPDGSVVSPYKTSHFDEAVTVVQGQPFTFEASFCNDITNITLGDWTIHPAGQHFVAAEFFDSSWSNSSDALWLDTMTEELTAGPITTRTITVNTDVPEGEYWVGSTMGIEYEFPGEQVTLRELQLGFIGRPIHITAVPEPSAYALVGLACVGALLFSGVRRWI